MAETLATYTTKVQADVDDTSTGSQSLVQQHIKEIYQDIMREAAQYLVGSVTTDYVQTIGDTSQTPTNPFLELRKAYYKPVSGTTFPELDEITEQYYLDNHINNTSGTPTEFYINAGNIVFDRPCSDAGTLRLVTVDVVAELINGATSLIPDRYTEVVKVGAIWKFLAFEKDPAAVDYEIYYHGVPAEKGMGGAKGTMLRELATRSKPVKPTLFGKKL